MEKIIRLALGVEYIGTHFHGWQTQRVGVRTVQLCVEQALAKIANHPIKVFCSGRTDAGVHAHEQVIHFDTNQTRSDRAWLVGANRYLPEDVSFKWVKQVSQDFHARFSAFARSYEYHLYNSPIRSALSQATTVWEPRVLEVKKMQEASSYLLGEHDFSAFRGSQCQAKSPIKTLEYLDIEQNNTQIIFKIKSNAFLHHMVRNIVGTLVLVGRGEKPVIWVKDALDSKNRAQAGITMPPAGLFFIKAHYPQGAGW